MISLCTCYIYYPCSCRILSQCTCKWTVTPCLPNTPNWGVSDAESVCMGFSKVYPDKCCPLNSPCLDMFDWVVKACYIPGESIFLCVYLPAMVAEIQWHLQRELRWRLKSSGNLRDADLGFNKLHPWSLKHKDTEIKWNKYIDGLT